MIKKTLLTLGITTMSIIGISNGRKVQPIGIDSYPSSNNNNYNITALKGGGLLTSYLGQGKSIIAFDSNGLFWRNRDGYPYTYSTHFQGYYGEYRSCDELTGTNSTLNNCTSEEITGDVKNLFKGFFSKVIAGDYFGYNYQDSYTSSANGYSRRYYSEVCWSSQEIGKTLCFRYGDCYVSSNLNACNNSFKGGTLVNSRNYESLTFGNIPYSEIGKAPGQNGYDGNWENTNDNITNITTGSCPTIAQILNNNYSSNYNSGLCYNNTTYFNGTSMETITKDDIFTIFNNDYENYTNRISIYRNNCNNINTTQACQNAFSGEYKKYSIIANASNSNVDEKKLWNYCNLSLNYDPNATTCVASGTIAEKPTQEEILNDIINMNTGIPTPGQATSGQENNVFNAICDPNDPNTCYGTGNVRDVFGSLKSIYGKIIGLFTERRGVNGIIPDYILWITFLTILFTIIFKK